jgi:excisionase family DNA binding protein
MEQEVMTVKDVAKYLKLSVITVYKLLKEGKIPGFRIGSSWRVNKQDLLNMMGKKVIK